MRQKVQIAAAFAVIFLGPADWARRSIVLVAHVAAWLSKTWLAV